MILVPNCSGTQLFWYQIILVPNPFGTKQIIYKGMTVELIYSSLELKREETWKTILRTFSMMENSSLHF